MSVFDSRPSPSLSKYFPLSLCSVVLETSSQSNSGEITCWGGRKNQTQNGEARWGGEGEPTRQKLKEPIIAPRRMHCRRKGDTSSKEGKRVSQSVKLLGPDFPLWFSTALHNNSPNSLLSRRFTKGRGRRTKLPRPTDLSSLSLLTEQQGRSVT